MSCLAAMSVEGVAAQSVHYEGGVSFATGDYIFTQRTNSWTLSTGLAVSAGPVTFRATLPVYLQNTSLLAGGATAFIPTGGSHAGAVHDSSASRGGQMRGRDGSEPASMTGMGQGGVEIPVVSDYATHVGDPTLTASVFVRGATSISLSGGFKVPLADTSSFGTGQWDYGGSVGLSRIVASSWLLSLDATYWHLGDLPLLELRDLVGGSVSTAYLTSSGWGVSASLSGSRAIIEGFDNPYYFSGSLSRVGRRTSVGVTCSFGLSDTAPDVSLGLFWRVGLAGT